MQFSELERSVQIHNGESVIIENRMDQMRAIFAVIVVSTLLNAEVCRSANAVVVESKSVVQGARGVTVGVYLNNDTLLNAAVIPLVIHSVTSGAFIKDSLKLQTQNRLTHFLYEYSTICQYPQSNSSLPFWCNGGGYGPPGRADFVSPDAVLYTGIRADSACLPDSNDGTAPGGTPSLKITFNVTTTLGAFEIDTTCTAAANHLLFVTCQDDGGRPIIPAFTKGVITIVPRTVSGHITHADTLAYSVNLTGDVTVDTGVTLTVLPDASILAVGSSDDQHGGLDTNHVEIIVKGTLVIAGGAGNRPTFGSTTGSAGSWYGIRVLSTGSFKSGNGLKIEKAIVGITVDKWPTSSGGFGNPPPPPPADTIRKCTITNCSAAGILNLRDSMSVLNDTITNVTNGDGIQIYEAKPLVKGNGRAGQSDFRPRFVWDHGLPGRRMLSGFPDTERRP
ncbi:MAG: hypothetical protein HY304_04305 [candidate division Zixibacteria bacterium]|nr:hypothetical protein [candidate division Zixibacteria bacterium]